MKTCMMCKIEKTFDCFYVKNAERGVYSSRCRPCHNAQIKANTDKPEVKRRIASNRLLKRYGITIEDKEEIFRLQGDVCGVCKGSDSLGPAG